MEFELWFFVVLRFGKGRASLSQLGSAWWRIFFFKLINFLGKKKT